MIKSTFFCILFCYVGLSCRPDNEKNDLTLIVKVNPVDTSTQLMISKIADSMTYTPLEATDASLFAKIDKLDVDSEGKYYVLDKNGVNGIAIFKRNGEFLRTISKVGKKKGEYESIADFKISENDNLEVYDNVAGKIIIYDKSGNLKQEVKCIKGANEFFHIADTLGFFSTCGGHCPDMIIYVKNSKRTFFVSKYNSFLYNSGNHFYANGGQLFVTNTFDNNIYLIKEGQPNKHLYVDFGLNIDHDQDVDPKKLLDSFPHDLSVTLLSPEYLYFTYTYQSMMIHSLYNFKSKKSYSSSAIINDFNYFLPIGQPIYSRGNFITTSTKIFPINENKLDEYIASNPLYRLDSNVYDKVKKLYHNAPSYGQYLLVTFRIK